MTPSGAITTERGGKCLPRRLCLLWIILLTSCQAPPAHFAGEDSDHVELPRPVILTRQIVADTAVEFAEHPLRNAAAVVTQTADNVTTVSQGLVGKHILIPLCGAANLAILPGQPWIRPRSKPT